MCRSDRNYHCNCSCSRRRYILYCNRYCSCCRSGKNATGIFAGLTPGVYAVTTTNAGCTSTATSLTVNAVPTAPAAPTASVTTQPTCTAPTGTITVTAPARGCRYHLYCNRYRSCCRSGNKCYRYICRTHFRGLCCNYNQCRLYFNSNFTDC